MKNNVGCVVDYNRKICIEILGQVVYATSSLDMLK